MLTDLIIKRGVLPLCAMLLLAASAQGEIIPAARRITWDPGVRGGIPTTRTVFANVKNPPYNAVGDGVANDRAAIQNAIDACPTGKVVYLPAGTYSISSNLQIKSGITLRGAGMGVTTIINSSNVNLITMTTQGMDSGYTAATPRNLTPAGLTKGSTSITTSGAHGWSAGDYIMVDQLKNPNGNPPVDNVGAIGPATWLGRDNGARCIGQWVKIVTVPSSTTATIDPPLYYNYDINFIPQGYKVIGATLSAGLEDITIDNSHNGLREVMEMDFCINCWLLRVELKGSKRRAIWMYGGLWNTISGCKIHDGVPVNPQPGSSYGSDRAYGIFLGPGPSACLVEDNIFHTLSNALAYEGGASGNVVSYNYMVNMVWTDTDNARMTVLGHGANPIMNLVEGNWLEGRFGVDCYWGTGAYFTVFRNRIQQQGPPRVSQTWTIDIDKRNWYQNIVGNVLGTNGREDTYELSGASYNYENGPKVIYRLGYGTIDTTFAGGDTQVKATIYRHGNWDSVNHTQLWESSNADHTLPSSLYLASKPSWFGTLAWPPFDPANPGAAAAIGIPAGYRYFNGVNPPPGGGNQPPTAVASANPTFGVFPLAVAFSSAGSSDPEGTPLTYSWTFGDNSGISSLPNPSHTYQSLGVYSARLTVSDGVNSVSSDVISITVTDQSTGSGLVAAYGFDEGSGSSVNDVSGHGNNGVIDGAAWAPAPEGKYGSALSFNGVNDLVVVDASSSSTLNVGSAITEEAWVYPTMTQSSWSTILHRQTDAFYLHASSPAGAMRPAGGAIFNGTESYVASTQPIPLNTWTHLAFTYDGTTIRLYANGILIISKPETGVIQPNANPLRMGGNYPYGQFFQGLIDEVRIYNRALSVSEIQADMATPLVNAPSPPANVHINP